MIPNFTSKNLIVNTLYEFFEKNFAFEFSKSLTENEAEMLFSNKESIQLKVKHYDSLFVLFESEINQTIFGANPILINTLFQDIKHLREFIYPDANSMLLNIQKWNQESSTESFNVLHFDQYMQFVNEQANKFVALTDKYIVRYDTGEFTKKEEDKTKWDKAVKRAKNNWIIVIILAIVGVLGVLSSIKRDASELISASDTQENKNPIKKDSAIVTTGLKTISGLIIDEFNNPVKGVCVTLKGNQQHSDTTDSFGRFFLTDLKGNGRVTENIRLTRNGFRDSSLWVKVDYNSTEQLNLNEITLKKNAGKTAQQLCEEGDIEACFKYANELNKKCPTIDGQARTMCIMKVEMWKVVGDNYKDLLVAKRDSGINSNAYKEAKQKWLNAKDMAKSMNESF